MDPANTVKARKIREKQMENQVNFESSQDVNAEIRTRNGRGALKRGLEVE